jgi:hypothetical protein
MNSTLGRKLQFWLLTCLAFGAVAGLAWTQRMPVLKWYYLRELARASREDRDRWVDRVTSLDTAAVPGLLELLQKKDPSVCDNAECVLTELVKQWGPEDQRTASLGDQLNAGFAGFSPLGQISGMQVMTAILRQEGPQTWSVSVTKSAGDVVQACRDRPELRGPALVLASVLLDRVPSGPWIDTCRSLAEKGLSDRLPRTRLAAVQLLMRPALQADTPLLAKVVPMLRDPNPVLRRAALVALASSRDLVSEDDLVGLLHDPDIDIQHLCEAALRIRDLSDEQIELARLISDESPRARLRVLERLGGVSNPSAWLRRLSLDPNPAVRAAAVRAVYHWPGVELADRLREMAQADPSETVRQNARYYLQATGRMEK